MLIDVSFFCIMFAELLVAVAFFNSVARRKHGLAITVFGGTMIFEVVSVVNVFFVNEFWINILLSFVLMLVTVLIFYEIKLRRAALYSIFLVSASTILEHMVVFIASSVLDLSLVDYDAEAVTFVAEEVIAKVLYLIVATVMIRVSQKDAKVEKVSLTFYVFPVATLLTLTGLWYISVTQPIYSQNRIILGVMCFVLVFSTLLVYFVLQSNMQKENRLLFLEKEHYKNETEIAYHNILKKQNNNLREYAHDAKNHLSVIKLLNENPEIDEHITKMFDELKVYTRVSHSGNQTLDVIIDKYVTECEMLDIDFSFDTSCENLLRIEAYDAVTLLGNLLDNAVEAASASKEKKIRFETDTKNGMSIIKITNSCDNSPRMNGKEPPATTKSDKSIHGIGLKSVTKTVANYKGDINFMYNDEAKEFEVYISLDCNGSVSANKM